MLGGILLRHITAPDADMPAQGRNACWEYRGQTQRNEQIWECTFPGKPEDDAFVVTLLFDEARATARTLYTVHAVCGDRLPRVPMAVRRAAEEFKRNLMTAA